MGATRQDLAGLLGVAVSTVQRLEMHSTYVGRQSLLRLILEYIADSRYVSAAEWQVLTSPLPPHARPPLRTASSRVVGTSIVGPPIPRRRLLAASGRPRRWFVRRL
jgi:hypothetical protein